MLRLRRRGGGRCMRWGSVVVSKIGLDLGWDGLRGQAGLSESGLKRGS
jgi:hypothetical protein